MAGGPDALRSLTPPPTPEALTAARDALDRASRAGFAEPGVAAYLYGGVQLEWRGPDAELRLLIHPDGLSEFLAHGRSRSPADAALALLAAVFGARA